MNNIIYGLLILIVLCMTMILISQHKDLKKLKGEVWELLNNRNHISRIEQGEIERVGRENRELIEAIASALDKKVDLVYVKTEFVRFPEYRLVDLTENEIKINELKSDIQGLEEEEYAGD